MRAPHRWEVRYRETLSETDPRRLPGRIRKTEDAMMKRFDQMGRSVNAISLTELAALRAAAQEILYFVSAKLSAGRKAPHLN